MSDTRREIRITVREPQPGWWNTVKDLAVRQGCFVSHLVVTAVNEYVQGQTARRPPPRVPYAVDRSNPDNNHAPL